MFKLGEKSFLNSSTKKTNLIKNLIPKNTNILRGKQPWKGAITEIEKKKSPA